MSDIFRVGDIVRISMDTPSTEIVYDYRGKSGRIITVDNNIEVSFRGYEVWVNRIYASIEIDSERLIQCSKE